ncbi:e3f675f0-b76e-4996-821c-db3fe56002c2 [Sclerotinia trifoliorum]|uniref:E3f675f0-b76e-4996-821c-db3fe56002c2 n=1 Tax=Sclerotinia trifoliorum TaxID=28548 RepID=A0A8H2ZPH5_9HELO|nr:e3f675f0-b76e-4996-821c-db3fe56002c2 [Sclerotinia trifoliorum]
MADPRDVEYEEEEATIDDQLLHAIIRGSIGTFNEVLERFDSPAAAVEYLNTHPLAFWDGDRTIGEQAKNVAAHVAASLGQDRIMDELLEQEGFECDPINSNGDTPLHCVVKWINREGRINRVGRNAWDDGLEMVKMMLRDGSDPRIRNNDGFRAEDLVNPDNTELKRVFADFDYDMGTDRDEGEEAAPEKNGFDPADLVNDDEEDVRSVYSGSDSEEEEEWKRRVAEKSAKSA